MELTTRDHCLSGKPLRLTLRTLRKREVYPMKSNDKEIDVREIRRKLGLNQSQFWSKIGVTQSGGSRYESGRNIPRPVQALLKLVHVEQVDIAKIRRDDVDVIEYLRQTNPDMLKSLRKEAKAAKKKA